MRYTVPTREKQDLTPEEVLSDAFGEVASRLERPIERRRFFAFGAILAFGVLALFARIAWLSVAHHDANLAVAEANRTRNVPLPAPRGIIYDRAGRQMVYNVPVSDLIADPGELPHDAKSRRDVAGRLSQFLHLSEDADAALAQKLLATSSKPVLVAEYLAQATSVAFASREGEFPGVSLRTVSSRRYQNAASLYHVLGHVGRVTAEDIDAGYLASDLTGKIGVEASYEKQLRGVPGVVRFEVNARGEIVKLMTRTEAQKGGSVVLSLDGNLQVYIFEQLKNAVRAHRAPGGAVVALDPRDGSIRALASFPSVDGALFSQGMTKEAYEKLLAQSGDPFFNRAIASRYPSGSTIKPFMGAAALQERVVTDATIIEDRGEITIPDVYVPGKVYTFHGYARLGPVNILSAIALSSDIYFYTVGGGYGSSKGLGADRIAQYLHLFGFGEKLGVDLPGEEGGLVPTPAYKKERKNEEWRVGDTYNISIGQGDMGVTPLQLAAATAAIANGGTLWRPHIADRVVDSEFAVREKFQPQIIRSGFIDPGHIETIRKGMRGTVQYGTARLLQQLPVAVAAKTGTAQTGKNSKYHALLTAFAPYENPEIVLAIIVEKAGEGSDVAVPMARDILDFYFQKNSGDILK